MMARLAVVAPVMARLAVVTRVTVRFSRTRGVGVRLADTLSCRAAIGVTERVRIARLRISLAGVIGDDRDLLADDALDGSQLRCLCRIAQRDGDASRTVAAGSADAVDVALGLV